jgi:septum formation protein
MRISRENPLVLASSSPRRRELLELARIPFEVVPAPADETITEGEPPFAYVARMARAKLTAATLAQGDGLRKGAVVLAADTVVVVDGSAVGGTSQTPGARVFGKPRDDDDARAMLGRLQGGAHEVATALALGSEERLLAELVVRTTVVFRPLDAADIDAYVATGEGRDKAGAYAMQGMASAFVVRIEGSPTNVIGLPTAELVMELRRLGLL